MKLKQMIHGDYSSLSAVVEFTQRDYEGLKEWSDDVFLAPDLFLHAYCGYWLKRISVEKVGQSTRVLAVVDEEDADDRGEAMEDALRIFSSRSTERLPDGYFILDAAVSARVYLTGVLLYGQNWYEEGDGGTYDVAVQTALLGEVVFG